MLTAIIVSLCSFAAIGLGFAIFGIPAGSVVIYATPEEMTRARARMVTEAAEIPKIRSVFVPLVMGLSALGFVGYLLLAIVSGA